jgi:predicted nucleic acid-binding protein
VNDVTAGLLDTSIFIARESGRGLGPLPSRVAVSVVTIGELQLGVLSAGDDPRGRAAAKLSPWRDDRIPFRSARPS